MSRRYCIVSIVLLLAFCAAAHACPMCKESIPNSDAQQASTLPAGFNNSVYLLLVGFMTVLGSVVTFLVKAIRNTPR